MYAQTRRLSLHSQLHRQSHCTLTTGVNKHLNKSVTVSEIIVIVTIISGSLLLESYIHYYE